MNPDRIAKAATRGILFTALLFCAAAAQAEDVDRLRLELGPDGQPVLVQARRNETPKWTGAKRQHGGVGFSLHGESRERLVPQLMIGDPTGTTAALKYSRWHGAHGAGAPAPDERIPQLVVTFRY